MNSGVRSTATLPFLLDTPRGKRFCLYHAPASERCAGAILYVHPFSEEMNMSRRMAALQSRAFAVAGYGVLQIDLFGCGDSDGELREADWELWRQDVVTAAHWLRRHVSPALGLWGLRLGATLALDVATSGIVDVDRCMLWQPVLDGRSSMTQFLRLSLATEMMDDNTQGRRRWNARDALANGETVEVGGYELSPRLVAGIDRIDFSALSNIAFPLHWFELLPDERTMVPPARMNIARAWIERGVDLRLHAITGPAFWATREVTECPRLIAETVNLYVEEVA